MVRASYRACSTGHCHGFYRVFHNHRRFFADFVVTATFCPQHSGQIWLPNAVAYSLPSSLSTLNALHAAMYLDLVLLIAVPPVDYDTRSATVAAK